MADKNQGRRSTLPAAEASQRAPPPPPAGEALPTGKPHPLNPPDPFNPDAATLRDQWRYAIRQYSRWYSQAWGTAILAGVSFFALGWLIKGSNPLPSHQSRPADDGSSDSPHMSKGRNNVDY